MNTIREDAEIIIRKSIDAAITAFSERRFKDGLRLVAIGKAAWRMAAAAKKALGDRIKSGVVITKYGHSKGEIEGLRIFEAGHPIPDRNTVEGTRAALDMVKNLDGGEVLFLVSGGGSALFEMPEDGVSLADIERATESLLVCGADIVEINTIRKRLSAVKGGKFALGCKPARVFSIVLSDVIGDRLDSIASGPACPDASTAEDALNIARKYDLNFPSNVMEKLRVETPKTLDNVETVITGSVSLLCGAASSAARELGYRAIVLDSGLSCEARDGGRFLGAMARDIHDFADFWKPCAVIVGGETVVKIKGGGKGGRNQEFALAAAEMIGGYDDTVVFSVGSDGTDGPTDAAGGIVDGDTKPRLLAKGVGISQVLDDNDSYNALKLADGLVFTGPTGTNVNDFAALLCR